MDTRCLIRPRLASLILTLVGVGFPAGFACGQSGPAFGGGRAPVAGSHFEAREDLRAAIFEAFDQDRPEDAAALIERYLKSRPNDPLMLYNLACAYALTERPDEAATSLMKAVEAGFRDFAHMRRDADLASIRSHPTYDAIIEASKRLEHLSAQTLIDRWRNTFRDDDDQYRYEVDEEHRLAFATALDEVAHDQVKAMLIQQADHLATTLFEAPPDYFAMVAVPMPEHAHRLLQGDMSIAGIYDHDQRMLVTRDIGGSLRHEFTHLMHYGHMERLGQEHPLWIKEGLASLYEDCTLGEDGVCTYHPNGRHNITRRLVQRNRALGWENLFELSHSRFMRQAGRLYPQVRSIFRYVASEGKLHEWYRVYVEHFDEDPTGRLAFERIFNLTLSEIESNWRDWVLDQPYIDNNIRQGDAALGITSVPYREVDGVYVEQIVPGASAASSDLAEGDVIVSIDGRPTRSLLELRQVVGEKSVGDRVTLRVRREDSYLEIPMTLRALDLPGR